MRKSPQCGHHVWLANIAPSECACNHRHLPAHCLRSSWNQLYLKHQGKIANFIGLAGASSTLLRSKNRSTILMMVTSAGATKSVHFLARACCTHEIGATLINDAHALTCTHELANRWPWNPPQADELSDTRSLGHALEARTSHPGAKFTP